jgi:hypothetical protein
MLNGGVYIHLTGISLVQKNRYLERLARGVARWRIHLGISWCKRIAIGTSSGGVRGGNGEADVNILSA